MPKEPPVERFKIWVDDVDLHNFGPTVAMLTKLGIGKVGFELIEDIKTFGKRTNHEVPSQDFLAEWIKDHPTFKAREACQYFEDNGRTKGAAYPALGVLVEKKILRKLGEGNYQRTDIKHLEGPKKKQKPKPKEHEITNAEFTLRYCKKNHGRFTTTKLREKFEEDGRQPASCNRAIGELLERRQIKRIGAGEYVLLSTMAEQPKTNGNGAATETAHG